MSPAVVAGGAADRGRQIPVQPGTAAAAQGQRGRTEYPLQDRGASTVAFGHIRYLFGESSSAAIGVIAKQPAAQRDHHLAHRRQPRPTTGADTGCASRFGTAGHLGQGVGISKVLASMRTTAPTSATLSISSPMRE